MKTRPLPPSRNADAFRLRQPEWMNRDELLEMVENPEL